MARSRPVSPVARGLKQGQAEESRACQAARADRSACLPDDPASLQGSAQARTLSHRLRRTRLKVRADC